MLAEFGYFFVGVAVGRLRLDQPRVVARLSAFGLGLGAAGGLGLVAGGRSPAGWQERTTWVDLGLDLLLTVGLLAAALGACQLVAVVATNLWARAGRDGDGARSGPVELVLRRISSLGSTTVGRRP